MDARSLIVKILLTQRIRPYAIFVSPGPLKKRA